MYYSVKEMKRYVVAITLFVVLPLLFLSLHPTAVNYYGDFSSLFWTYLTKSQLVVPNTIGILSDLLVLHVIFFSVYPKRRVTSDRLLQLLESGINILKDRSIKNITQTEWLNIRVYLVKIFFAPLMVLFAASLIRDLFNNSQDFLLNLHEGNLYFMLFALAIMSLMFIIDVICFCLGYFTESPKLDNLIQSVDPTVSGWLICLICYPPFNAHITDMVGGMYEIGATVSSPHMTFILTVVGLGLMVIYTKASVDLLFKASNLTYRGLVTHGTYGIVRHPAYASKVSTWIILTLPFTVVNPWLILTIMVWTTVYILRALTEERHLLLADPENYSNYIEKVPYRFIPKIF